MAKLKIRKKRDPEPAKSAAQAAAKEIVDTEDAFSGPSPNPKTNLVFADVALRAGALLVRQGIERGLLGKRYAPEKARSILKGRTLPETLVGGAIAKLATKSVPGAIIVGGGLLAKTLYDRRKSNLTKAKGEVPLEKMAEDGKEDET